MSIWPKEPLGRHAEIRARIGWRGLSSAEYTTEGPFLIAGQHIKNGRVDWDACDHLSEERYQESSEIALRCGDVIISKDGTIGRVARIDALSSQATLNGTMMLVRPRPSLEYRYLYHFLGGHTFQKLIEDKVSGSSIPHLFQRDMVSLTVDMPPLKEQSRIAAVLDTVDEAIAKTEAVIAKLKQVRIGLLHDLLTCGLDEHGQLRDPIAHPEQFQDSPLGRIPREWEIKALNEIVASAVDGPFGSNLKTEHYVNEPGVRVVRLQNIESNWFDESDKAFVSEDHAFSLQRHQVASGDLLVASMGDENHPLARACLYPAHLPLGIVKADCFRLRMKPMMATNGFVMLLLNCPSTRRGLNVLGQGVTRDRVNLTTLLTLRVLRPPVEEQRHIVKMIDALDLRMQTEEALHSKLAFLKSGLMSDLLTGRVRVPEEITVAS